MHAAKSSIPVRASRAVAFADPGEAVADLVAEMEAQCREAHGEAMQLQGVLADGMEKLLASFQQLTRLVEVRHDLAGVDAMSGVAEEVDREVGRAVTALQFQDLASQLVERGRRRMDLVVLLAGAIESWRQDAASDPRAAGEALRDRVAEFRSGLARASVQQASMTPGAAELF